MNPAAQFPHTGAVILAAGQSRRMGTPKLVLPWGSETVVGRVVSVLQAAGIGQIVVVTGANRVQVESALQSKALTLVHNPQYTQSEMLASLQIGLRALDADINGSLVVLGDQPQIEAPIVEEIARRAGERLDALIVPSYQNRRGHPWLAGRALWEGIFALNDPPQTLRDFLRDHARQIEYVNVDSPSVLADVDTPEDYHRQRPQNGA
ncbi:MAG TPA: nucleotidyltransferase family protein [Anaerolineaceae bacterium]